MADPEAERENRRTVVRIGVLAALILGITALHYLTGTDQHYFHDIYRRLYYLPIVLAGLWFALRGGVTVPLLVSILYAPHVLFQWGHHPSMELEQYLEILLYNAIGFITGFLTAREQAERRRYRNAAEQLQESYGKLREQADMILEIEEQLRRADRLTALGELSAGMAHEIRNPLGSIRGTAEILRDAFPKEDRRYEFAEILIREVERLNKVVQDFLTFARPEQPQGEGFDLNRVVQDVIELNRPQARQKGITCRLITGSVPGLLGRGEQIQQVLLNLLLNAFDATPQGGTVEIETGAEGKNAFLQVRDSGRGIPAADLERIFNPFFTTRSEGTGLGLAIVHRIIEGHGGAIRVTRNDPEPGVCFRVELPLKENKGD